MVNYNTDLKTNYVNGVPRCMTCWTEAEGYDAHNVRCSNAATKAVYTKPRPDDDHVMMGYFCDDFQIKVGDEFAFETITIIEPIENERPYWENVCGKAVRS